MWSISLITILLGAYIRLIDSQSTGSNIDQRVCCFKDRVVTSCFNPCSENTCENLRNGSQTCPEICLPNECVCRDGLYRNECNECVTKEECSKNCTKPTKLQCTGQFEILYGCLDPTQARVCPTTRCSKPRDFLLKYAKRSKQQGLCALNTCDCIDGYLRNKCGQCVPPNECGRPCCVGKCSKCSGPNEVRVKKFRKCTARTCKNLKSPMKCKGRAARVRKNVCDCKNGYRRNKCGKCVPENECSDNVPCVCTDPCAPRPNRKWQCFNDCNRPTCKNYYELQTKTCPSECTYVCACDGNLGLFYNGTHCVRGENCPPYEIAKQFPYVSLSELTLPAAAIGLTTTQTTQTTQTMEMTQPSSTETTTTTTTEQPAPPNPIISITVGVQNPSSTTQTVPSTAQNPSNPLLSIGSNNDPLLSIGKK